MTVTHMGYASIGDEGFTWCTIEGVQTSQQALAEAHKKCGGYWIMPVLPPEKLKDWPTNPKRNAKGNLVWLLRMA